MTLLLLALGGALVSRWLRAAWEAEQDRRLLRAFPPFHPLVDPSPPTAAEITAGVSLTDMWGDGVTPDPARWRQT